MCSSTSSTDGAAARSVAAGLVGRPHGLDGSFHVVAPKPRLLRVGASVRLGERICEIDRKAGTEKAPIVRLSGIADREAALAVKGVELIIDAEDLPKLDEGEWWAHELEGLTVRDGELLVGAVSRMIELPSCEALEVERPGDSAPLLIPMVRDAVRKVDVEQGLIDVDLRFLGVDS